MSLYPERNPKVAWRKIEGETVIISPEDSHVHELNETASLIWEHADGKHSIDEIAALVAAGYEVPPAVAKSDVEGLVEVLSAKGLLTAPKRQEVFAGA
ncbi:MAG TPA: PqqD family protein [Candidatus Acidoferrum sp.]|nr:PqqD family protein [Candidatus Acidoferrum sp.]